MKSSISLYGLFFGVTIALQVPRYNVRVLLEVTSENIVKTSKSYIRHFDFFRL